MLRRQMREITERIVANGRVEHHEIKVLEQLLYSDGKIDRKEANFLVKLHKRVANRSLQNPQRPCIGKRFYWIQRSKLAARGFARR